MASFRPVKNSYSIPQVYLAYGVSDRHRQCVVTLVFIQEERRILVLKYKYTYTFRIHPLLDKSSFTCN